VHDPIDNASYNIESIRHRIEKKEFKNPELAQLQQKLLLAVNKYERDSERTGKAGILIKIMVLLDKYEHTPSKAALQAINKHVNDSATEIDSLKGYNPTLFGKKTSNTRLLINDVQKYTASEMGKYASSPERQPMKK
jgi:hypothetical protein